MNFNLDEFERLSEQVRVAEAEHTRTHDEYAWKRKELEKCSRSLNDAKAAMRAFIEKQAGARLWP